MDRTIAARNCGHTNKKATVPRQAWLTMAIALGGTQGRREEVTLIKENGGAALRALRKCQKLTLLQAEARSREIAELRGIPQYGFTASWLSHVETRRLVPTIYKFVGLSEALRVPLPEILRGASRAAHGG